MKFFKEKDLHGLFRIGVFIKLVDSIIEVLLGSALYFLSLQTINGAIFFVFGDELGETPRDTSWSFLFHGFNGLAAHTQYLWAGLFLGHGIIKLFLVYGLLKNKIWAYPISALAFGCFAIYQILQIIHAPTLPLEVLTVIDALFIALIIHEYRHEKNRSQNK